MGLFDFSYDDPQSAGRLAFAAGLLDAAGPQTRPVSLGQALSAGLLGGQRASQVAGESNRRNQLVDLQMSRIRQQQEEEQRARLMQQQQAEFLGRLPAQLNMPGGQGPTVAAAQNQGRLTPQMVATAMQLGIDPKRLESIVGAQNIGRPEVKHWADVRNPDGSVSVTGFDQFGDPRNTGATPYKAPEFRDLGGSVVGIDPITMKPLSTFGKTMTPGERDSSGRGWANINLEREKWAEQQKQGKAPKTHYDPARGVVVNEATGTASPVTLDGKPIGDKATAEAKAKREAAAGNVLNLLDEADKLLEKSTASYAGAGVDLAARGFGISTPGSQAAAQLKALEGAIMMAQPRMEGPQSNYDVELYRQMAGSIGDATLPAATRKAAIETIRALHKKYAGGGSSEIPGATDIQRAAAEELKRRGL